MRGEISDLLRAAYEIGDGRRDLMQGGIQRRRRHAKELRDQLRMFADLSTQFSTRPDFANKAVLSAVCINGVARLRGYFFGARDEEDAVRAK
jgi:hypothetical protein